MFPARLPDFSNLFYSSFSSVQKRKYKKICFGSDAPGYESLHKTMRSGLSLGSSRLTFSFQQNWVVWYQLGGLILVRYQLGANRWGLPFNIFIWFIGLGGSRILLHIWRTSAEKSAIEAFYGGTPTHLHSDTLIGFLNFHYPRRCKISLVGQSAGLSIPRSFVRFWQKNPRSRNQIYVDLNYIDSQARVPNYCDT